MTSIDNLREISRNAEKRLEDEMKRVQHEFTSSSVAKYEAVVGYAIRQL